MAKISEVHFQGASGLNAPQLEVRATDPRLARSEVQKLLVRGLTSDVAAVLNPPTREKIESLLDSAIVHYSVSVAATLHAIPAENDQLSSRPNAVILDSDPRRIMLVSPRHELAVTGAIQVGGVLQPLTIAKGQLVAGRDGHFSQLRVVDIYDQEHTTELRDPEVLKAIQEAIAEGMAFMKEHFPNLAHQQLGPDIDFTL